MDQRNVPRGSSVSGSARASTGVPQGPGIDVATEWPPTPRRWATPSHHPQLEAALPRPVPLCPRERRTSTSSATPPGNLSLPSANLTPSPPRTSRQALREPHAKPSANLTPSPPRTLDLDSALRPDPRPRTSTSTRPCAPTRDPAPRPRPATPHLDPDPRPRTSTRDPRPRPATRDPDPPLEAPLETCLSRSIRPVFLRRRRDLPRHAVLRPV
jgi:hypothetical protein